MAVFSSLRAASNNLIAARSLLKNQVRNGGSFVVRPSRWGWDTFKDQLHFYILIAAIPWGIAITAANVFVGPGELKPIPEGYRPEEHEYHRNPVTRFMVKTFKASSQATYEIHLHEIWEEQKIAEMRQLRDEVHRQMQLHGDYKGWYYRDDIATYTRAQRNSADTSISARGGRFYGDT